LGLALAAFAVAFMGTGLRQQLISSVLFCMSLCFKQMALYYATAFFFYFLGVALHKRRTAVERRVAPAPCSARAADDARCCETTASRTCSRWR
jgi:hypothetical protein